MLYRFAEPRSFFDPETLSTFPSELHIAVGEEVRLAPNYMGGEVPRLAYPHLFEYLKSHDIGPSTELIEAIKRTPYTVLVGPSGSGRNTLIEQLFNQYPDIYQKSLSKTTRPFRLFNGVMEVQGQAYDHIAPQEFIEEIINGNFLEWEIIHTQQASGVHADSIMGIPAGKIGLNETELKGAERLYEIDGRKSIFVVPEDFGIWTTSRINGCEESERVARLQSSRTEMLSALHDPYFVYFVNRMADARQDSEEYFNSLAENSERLHKLILANNSCGEILDDENKRDQSIARALLVLHIARIDIELGNPVV